MPTGTIVEFEPDECISAQKAFRSGIIERPLTNGTVSRHPFAVADVAGVTAATVTHAELINKSVSFNVRGHGDGEAFMITLLD